MADHYYGANLGDTVVSDVAVDTSTTSAAVELRVTDATTGITGQKQVLLKLLDLIRRKIEVSDAPA